jgi:DNA polymerase-3 subunit alpha
MQKQERTTKTGQKFAFVQFSDEAGSFEVAFFSETYQQYRELLVEGKLLLIEVNARNDSDQIRLTAQTVEELQIQNHTKNIIFNIDQTMDVELLKKFMEQISNGNNTIIFNVNLGGKLPTVLYKLCEKYEWDPVLENKARQLCNVSIL